MKGFNTADMINMQIKKHGGLTCKAISIHDSFVIDKVEYTSGYEVGVKNLYEGKSRVTAYLLSECIMKRSSPDSNIGFWQDGDTLYIDEVHHEEDLFKAMSLGRDNDELAIWDWSNNLEVHL